MTQRIDFDIVDGGSPIDLQVVGDEAMSFTVEPAGGGTFNYNELENKPSIEGVTLVGDVSLEDIGAADAEDVQAAQETADAALTASGKAVRFDAAQTLTDAQKAQARGNIAAADAADVSELKSAIDEINDELIYNQTREKNASVSVTTGHGIPPSERIVSFEVETGEQYDVTCTFTAGITEITSLNAMYKDGTNSYIRYTPASGIKYTFTASKDIIGFSVYVTNANVTADATLTLTVTVHKYNTNSLEYDFNTLKESVYTKPELAEIQPGYFAPFVSANKYNMDTDVFGRLDANNVIAESTQFLTSDYIDLQSNTTGYVYAYVEINTGKTNGWCICFYTTDKTFISGERSTSTNLGAVSVPVNARYARACVAYNANWVPYRPMFVFGDAKIPWVKYSNVFVQLPIDLVESAFPWTGKTWLSYGDSITAIGNGNAAGCWQEYVTNALHFGTQIVRGIGGQTYKWRTNGGSVTFVDAVTGEYNSRNDSYNKDNYTGDIPSGCVAIRGSFCSWDRIVHMIPDAIKDTIDLIFVFGVNDGNQDIIGEMPIFVDGDTTDTEWASADENVFHGDFNVQTLEGAVASTLLKLQTRCPNALIVTGTSWSGRGEASGVNYPNVMGVGIFKEGEVVNKVSQYFSFNTIDLYHTLQVNPWNRSRYVTDTIHPYNDLGKQALARAVISGLRCIYPRFDVT